ncbi:unnamed protein product [Periconia digitata]|uniref:Cytochrome P450 n=1 Tax=Periconia digitata TaxID=1303443 RepID=A0A9W4UHA8_9PLEO|nr:unnamed protein product [Periconia digitata]
MAVLSLLVKACSLGLVALVAHFVLAYLRSSLKKLPGPFAAKFTNLWRLRVHYKQTHIETTQALHKKYGDVVQLGPNVVSLADPRLVKIVYSTRGTYRKSDFYTINDAMQPDGSIVSNLFATRDNEFHAQKLRPVQKLYSLQNAREFQPMMDASLESLCHQLEERFVEGANTGKTCDIADWISYFTWDFLGDMTLGKSFGFMEAGDDIGSMIANAEKPMRYFSVVGQIPVLDKWLAKNPRIPLKFPDFSVVAGFCVNQFQERMKTLDAAKDRKDYMSAFLKIQQEDPNVTIPDVIGYLIINILGGADTTSIILKSIFYYLLTHPTAHSTLVTELHSANLTYPPSYDTLESLPYLSACIQEALRIHPVVGQILERVVPSSGLTVPYPTADSKTSITLLPGTIVGMNPWVVHRREEVYGENPDEYIPERWLQGKGEADTEYAARIRAMKDADLSFGGGNRVCLGRPLALVELFKTTAMVFGKYKMELENPDEEWVLHKQWFVWPHRVRVKMSAY